MGLLPSIKIQLGTPVVGCVAMICVAATAIWAPTQLTVVIASVTGFLTWVTTKKIYDKKTEATK